MNSLWIDSAENFNNYPCLNKNLDCDVCIIGAGIFGVTCGYYLSKLGYKVVLLDKYYVGYKTTGHTTRKNH